MLCCLLPHNNMDQPLVVVQLLSRVWLFTTPWTVMPGSSVLHYLWSLLKSCPLSRWCYLTISSSAAPFSFCLQSFPASGSFPKSCLFTSGGQSIEASASVFKMNIQDWFPLGLPGLISLLSKGLSRVFSSTTVRKHQFFGIQPPLWSNSHIHTRLLEKLKLWL